MGNDRQGSTPYYQQVANVLRAQIISLEDDAPVQLPTERDLCRMHEVSRETIRKALLELEADGLIERAPSRGTLTVPAGIRAWRKLRKSRLISVVTSGAAPPNVPMSFYGRILQGVVARAEAAGYSITIRSMREHFPTMGPDYGPEDPAKVLGVIITGIQDERLIAMHAQAGYPVVVVDHWSRDAQVDSVVIDCFGEGERAGEFLLEQGHRNLFYVGNVHGPKSGREHEADADLLLAGFARALRRAGVDLPAARVFFCRQEADELADVARQIAGMQSRPTAGLIFGSQALGHLLGCLASVGLACPEDVSLICKAHVGENLEAAAMRGDAGAMGRLAVDLLLERASGRREEAVCLAVRSTLQRGPTVRHLASG